MPGGEAVTQDTRHDLARQGVGLELREQWLDAEETDDSQQQHQDQQPEIPAPQCRAAQSHEQEKQQVGGTRQPDPADQFEQPPASCPASWRSLLRA
jgi:hypothetical protein